MPGQEIQEPARRGRKARQFDASAPLPPQPVAICKKGTKSSSSVLSYLIRDSALLIERVAFHYPLELQNSRISNSMRSPPGQLRACILRVAPGSKVESKIRDAIPKLHY